MTTTQNAPERHAQLHLGVPIYPISVCGLGERWAVQAGDRPATGDTIHATLEQAKGEVELLLRRRESDARRAAVQADARARAEGERAARLADDVNGFLSGTDALRAGRLREALEKQIRFKGAVMTLRQAVESLHRAGAMTVETITEPKIKPMSRRQHFRASAQQQREHERRMKAAGERTISLVGGFELGKTAYDYAGFLTGKASDVSPCPDVE